MSQKIIRNKCLYFRRGYKYQVSRDYQIKLAVIPFEPVNLPFLTMDTIGTTIIKSGYAWNGASGPAFDSLNSMAGSLVHDVIYQLIRLGLIDKKYKAYADQLLKEICSDDGMSIIRSTLWCLVVGICGWDACRPSAERKEEVAP